MRVAKVGYIVMSIALCLFGILMIVYPGFSIEAIGIGGGVCLILFGAVKLVGYFSKDLFRLAFQYDLAFGILLISLGVIVLIRPGNLMNFLCLALGIAILADGLFKVQIAVDARTFGIRPWWLILALAVLTGALGLALVFRPSESAAVLVTLLGVALLAEGILNLSTVLSAVKIIRHQRSDRPIEADFREIE
jgi:uncharacterized membrane protein HdeD (DUF308 family)